MDSFNPPSTLGSNLYQSQSNPDLMSICYDDLRVTDYPEHVLKVRKNLSFFFVKQKTINFILKCDKSYCLIKRFKVLIESSWSE